MIQRIVLTMAGPSAGARSQNPVLQFCPSIFDCLNPSFQEIYRFNFPIIVFVLFLNIDNHMFFPVYKYLHEIFKSKFFFPQQTLYLYKEN